jgi:malonyl-CoA O-methyltransferase
MTELAMTVKKTIHLPTRDGYDLWSELYDIDGNPLVLMEEPRVEALLGNVGGLQVLDVGCGTGRHSVRLAEAGALVTGIDFSAGMLSKARAKSGAEKAIFLVHDLSRRFPFADEAFDRAICCLVLDHIHALPELFGEMARVCRQDGFLVCSVMHPAMMLKGVQARFHDPATGAEVRPESAPNQISDYVMAALDAGLRIEHISEHSVDDAIARQAPRAEKYLGWPMLLMLKLARNGVAR